MPRRGARIFKTDECLMDPQLLLNVLYDVLLYERFPLLAPFRPKMVWLRGRVLKLRSERIRDGKLRKWYNDIVEEFKELLWDLQDEHRELEGFPAFMKERHRIEAERFVCYSHHRRITLT
ncbi:hypothetical protein LCGC14_0812750 [marine sediment metagenome]|uniref:Uncharacterized protein n=1 Tax=marine sediment metagenome TaxID=412755 RepID=A0A0F9S626_9ZZZZ